MSVENGLHNTTATDEAGDFIFSLLSFLFSRHPTYIYICFTPMNLQEVRTYVRMYVYTQLNHRLKIPTYVLCCLRLMQECRTCKYVNHKL